MDEHSVTLGVLGGPIWPWKLIEYMEIGRIQRSTAMRAAQVRGAVSRELIESGNRPNLETIGFDASDAGSRREKVKV